MSRWGRLIFLIAPLGLVACGLTGDLERPAPLWGDKDRTGVEAAAPVRDNTVRIGEDASVFETSSDLFDDAPEPQTNPSDAEGGETSDIDSQN